MRHETRYAYIHLYQVYFKRFDRAKRETQIITIKFYKTMKKFLILGLFAVLMAISLQSCNVTRTTTTTASTYQRGDTTIMVQTKTIESYDATKK